MTSIQSQQLLEDASRLTERLITEARSDVSAKILKVDEACRSILKSGGLVTMKSVRAWLSTNAGLTIASQTLMNKRVDKLTGEKVHSPLRQVIDKYAEVRILSSTSPSKNAAPSSLGSVVLSDAELALVSDHQVRYKVQLIAGRVRNLETQLNQLRMISKLPTLSSSILSDESSETRLTGSLEPQDRAGSILNEEEIEALADFLKQSSLNRRGLSFDGLGRLKVTHPASQERKTVSLSTPDLKSALEKILKWNQG